MKSITRRFRSHLSFANVMATMAVFIALGGTSYAAVMITGADVRDGSLTGRDVRDSSLGASDVISSSLGTGEIRDGSLNGRDVRDSSLGASDVINSSLGTGEIRDGSLNGRDVRDSSLGSSDVIDGSLLARDFRPGQLQPGPKGDQGPAGAASRFFLLDENGNIVEQSGGFTVVSKPGTTATGQPTTNPNVYIRSTTSLVNKGLSATIAGPALDGDAAVARCASTTAVTTAVTCVPTNTNNDNTLVVRARADNSTLTSAARRVYVHVTP